MKGVHFLQVEREWIIKHLADEIRNMEEDVELNGRQSDIDIAKSIKEKFEEIN